MPSLAVILVHYHTPAFLVESVAALQKDLAAGGLRADLIVIDNGNTTDGEQQVQRLPVRYFNPGSNLGYAGGVNLGVRHTDADFLILMNPDVMVRPGCVTTLLDALHDGAAAAGPRLYLDSEKRLMLPPNERQSRIDALLNHIGTRSDFAMATARRRWRTHARLYWRAAHPVPCSTLNGSMLAIRREAWQRVGPFDDGFQLYFEETDWLQRLHRLGLAARYVPAAEAVHAYNQSAWNEPAAPGWYAESWARFARRYYGAGFLFLLQRLAVPVKPPPTFQTSLPEVRLDFSENRCTFPLWVELAEGRRGFPAATECIVDTERHVWCLPDEVWDRLAPGSYYVQVVDDAGIELLRLPFKRLSSEL
jgi:GT2 family glycosyltransferase